MYRASNTATNKLDLDYQISDSEKEYTEITSFKLDGNTVTADISNITGTDFTATVIAAAYDENDALVELKSTEKTIKAGETGDIFAEVTGGNKVKGFIWSSLDGMSPVISDVVDAQNSEITGKKVEVGGNATAVVAFDWKPGNSVRLQNENGEDMIALSKTSTGAVQYTSGKNPSKTLHGSLTSNGWYHTEITIDTASKTADISMMDYTNGGSVKTIYAVPFSGINGMFDKISLSGSIDNLTVNKIAQILFHSWHN